VSWCLGGEAVLFRMHRSIRNRLVDLFLNAFDSPQAEDTLRWCLVCCELAANRTTADLPVAEVLAGWRRTDVATQDRWIGLRRALASLEGMLDLRAADRESFSDHGAARVVLRPEIVASLPAVRETLRAYATVLEEWGERDARRRPQDPMTQAVAEAARCFNAALFFEAHELLEHRWIAEPRGPRRQFLQGLIQVSVGFHHARRGSFDGAVNQLEKGLAKLVGVQGNVMGLDCDRFVSDVTALHGRLVRCGRADMRPLPSDETVRMRIADEIA
jgi:hypothetical protein